MPSSFCPLVGFVPMHRDTSIFKFERIWGPILCNSIDLMTFIKYLHLLIKPLKTAQQIILFLRYFTNSIYIMFCGHLLVWHSVCFTHMTYLHTNLSWQGEACSTPINDRLHQWDTEPRAVYWTKLRAWHLKIFNAIFRCISTMVRRYSFLWIESLKKRNKPWLKFLDFILLVNKYRKLEK